LSALILFFCAIAFAQNPGRVTLPGHMHPAAIAANDLGRTDSALTLQHVSIFLKPTAQQQADLNSLLEQQQDPSSPNYHNWLTPEQYADRFGATAANVASIVTLAENPEHDRYRRRPEPQFDLLHR
jgi:subtilase family serine protease